MLRWAAVAIGLLATALGITLLVAANWDVIRLGEDRGPWAADDRRGVHRLPRQAPPPAAEVALFLFGALVLAGVALQDQIYQVPQPLWGLLGWVKRTAPAVLIAGTTRLTATGWRCC